VLGALLLLAGLAAGRLPRGQSRESSNAHRHHRLRVSRGADEAL